MRLVLDLISVVHLCRFEQKVDVPLFDSEILYSL